MKNTHNDKNEGAESSASDKKKAVSDVSYMFNESSQVIRRKGNDDEVLATLQADGRLEYESEDTRKFHPQVERYLTDEAIQFDPETVTTKPSSDRTKPQNDADIAKENTKEYNAKIPKSPKKTPHQGDKTPAYVEWLKKYKPKTYAQRYGIIGEGEVTHYHKGKDPETGRPTVRAETSTAMLSTRKTHLTQKREAANDEGGDSAENN